MLELCTVTTFCFCRRESTRVCHQLLDAHMQQSCRAAVLSTTTAAKCPPAATERRFKRIHKSHFKTLLFAPAVQANDVPKFPCSGESNYSYTPDTGAGSLAVEFVSSSITSGYKCVTKNAF